MSVIYLPMSSITVSSWQSSPGFEQYQSEENFHIHYIFLEIFLYALHLFRMANEFIK